MITQLIREYVEAVHIGDAFEDGNEFEYGIICNDFYTSGKFKGIPLTLEFCNTGGFTITREERDKNDYLIGYELGLMPHVHPHEMTEEDVELYKFCKRYAFRNNIITLGDCISFTAIDCVAVYEKDDCMLPDLNHVKVEYGSVLVENEDYKFYD